MTWNPINWIKSVFKFLTSPKAQEEASRAAQVFVQYIPLVAAFAATNYESNKVVQVFVKYGLPVAADLASGVAPIDEIKKLVGQAVSTIISHNESLSTTAANIAQNLAYLEVKNNPALVAAAAA